MIIATGKSRKDTRWHNQELSWEQFITQFKEPHRTHETVREYKEMSKDQRGAVKDVGGFVGGRLRGGRRRKDTVIDRCLITLDLDDAKQDAWENASLWGWKCMMYSTHSHTPEKPRFRLVYPLDRAVPPDEYEPIARKIAEAIGIDQTDASTFDTSRLMYYPSCPVDGEYVYKVCEGDYVSADEILHTYGVDEDAWMDVRLWPSAKSEPIKLQRETKKQGDPTQKPGIVGLFCRTYDVPAAIDEFLSDIYMEDEGQRGRYTYAQGSGANGAVLYSEGQFLYSHHGTDPAGGHLCNAFDLVRVHKFGELDYDADPDTPVNKLPSYLAMQDFAAELPEVKKTLVDEKLEETRKKFEDLESLPDVEQGEEEQTFDPDWMTKLSVNRKTGEADPLINNAILILRNDPNLRGKIGINAFRMTMVARGPLPWKREIRDKRNGDLWGDNDDAGLRAYMETAWKLKGRQIIDDALSIVCQENAFDPVRDYLNSLHWDGIERLDSVLIRLFGAEDCEYTRLVTRKWAVAAVRRIFEPGCKFDTMLTLVGDQGAGKSQFGAIMSKGWFTDSIQRIDNKDAYDQLLGVWIVEMSELYATRKAENEAIKAFYSKQEDTFRRAYERRTVTFPRHCVFIGTTNDRSFIKDETGGRRFWPVELTATRADVVERLDHLRGEVDQLWAEAVYRYRSGEKTYEDTTRLLDLVGEAQQQFTQEDEWMVLIEQYLDTPIPDNWDELAIADRVAYVQHRDMTTDEERSGYTRLRDKVSIMEIRTELFEDDVKRGAGGGNETSRHIARLMNVMPGWEKHGKYGPNESPYGRQRVYCRT